MPPRSYAITEFDSLTLVANRRQAAKDNRRLDLSTRQLKHNRSKYMIAKASVLISILALTQATRACCFRLRKRNVIVRCRFSSQIDRQSPTATQAKSYLLIFDRVSDGGIRIPSRSCSAEIDPDLLRPPILFTSSMTSCVVFVGSIKVYTPSMIFAPIYFR